MRSNPYKYQTLRRFIDAPFGNADVTRQGKLDIDYNTAKRNNEIRIKGFTKLNTSYLFNVGIKSKSKSTKEKRYDYDVIIQFFPPSEREEKKFSLGDYYVKFFSNSPSFIYKYAALYKKYGFLIDALYDKLDPEFADKLPQQTNANMEMYYDKSIYFASKFVIDRSLKTMNKLSAGVFNKQIAPAAFFKQINDFATIKIDQILISSDLAISKELSEMESDMKKDRFKRYEQTIEQGKKRKMPEKKKKSTSTPKVSATKKGIVVKSKIKGKAKKKAVRSTFKHK